MIVTLLAVFCTFENLENVDKNLDALTCIFVAVLHRMYAV
jgi:hypothetical protein